jgi:hypothetical protein
MGLRPTHGDESANVRCRRINGLWRAFNRAGSDYLVGMPDSRLCFLSLYRSASRPIRKIRAA